MKSLEQIFDALAKSSFRRRFQLQGKDLVYLQTKGLPVVLSHAADFVTHRLAPAEPANDGKQTPYRGHPVFVAQHATACCCRGCLEKWHKIPCGRALDEAEQAHIVAALEWWLQREMLRATEANASRNEE